MSFRSWLALALAAGALGGCARSGRPPAGAVEVVDLLPLVPAAEAWAETAELDLGKPESRWALWEGFGPDQRSGDRDIAWGLGDFSELVFRVVEPRDLALRLRGWSFAFEGGGGVDVAVEVNGERVGEAHFGRAAETAGVALPARSLRPGENRLRLVYSRHHEIQRRGELARAVAWDGLKLDGVAAASALPGLAAEGRALELPAGTGLDLVATVPTGAALAWNTLEGRGGAVLEVAWKSEGGAASVRRPSPAAAGGRLDLGLAGSGADLVHFTLRVPAAAAPNARVRVEGLRLETPVRPGSASTEPEAPPSHAPATGPPAAPGATAAAGAPRRPNIVVYLVDTLRADHLGCYGYARPTSPELDRFAAGATLFTAARAQSSWTRPTVATILSGLYPLTHGASDRWQKLGDDVETVGERLRRLGYQTAMATTNANTSERFGFAQGYDDFRYLKERADTVGLSASSEAVNRWAFRWLDGRDRARPFFLFLHTVDPHAPYVPPPAYRRRFAPGVDAGLGARRAISALATQKLAREDPRVLDTIALYDAEIAANDASFGRLLERLAGEGIADETVVVFLSDHGEEFLEHRHIEHGHSLYEEQLLIPMVWRVPGAGAGARVDGPAEQIDLLPTLLDLLGEPADPRLPGRSLLASLRTGDAVPERASYAWLDRLHYAYESVELGARKLIRANRPERWGGWPAVELYDLGADRAEHRNLALERDVFRRYLEGQLRWTNHLFRPRAAAAEAEPDPELEKSLRALGYLN